MIAAVAATAAIIAIQREERERESFEEEKKLTTPLLTVKKETKIQEIIRNLEDGHKPNFKNISNVK